MPQEVIQVSLRNPLIKILTILLLLVAGVWSYFAVRWYIGNTLAEYFNPAEGGLIDANRAASLAPSDPMTHWRMAQVAQKNLPLDQQAQAVAEYEKAVSLSPYDYRYWMTLGTAQEQAGDPVKAEQALKRAVALAPAYAYPHWYLGNLYVRNGRYDEAFAELRLAAAADQDFQGQLFNLIWEVHSDDLEAAKKAAGPDAPTRAEFALYLIGRSLFDQGLRVWNVLSSEEKKANRGPAGKIILALNAAHRFHDSLQVWNDISDEKYHGKMSQVFDGGFEEPVEYARNSMFSWQVNNNSEIQIGIDPGKRHEGTRSLRFIFGVRNDFGGVIVKQLVPVEPRTQYDFEFYVATDKLVTGGPPQVQIIDAADETALVSSPTAATGTNPWNRVGLSFKTGENTQMIIVNVMRVSCGTKEVAICPIFGSVWYDDFNIKRRN
jgi:tetratricopeptide (TPR) repeat protein